MHISTFFENFPIIKTQDKTPEARLIQDFCDEINQEREKAGWKYKVGKTWKKLEPMTWIKTQQKLAAIRTDRDELQSFFTECQYEQKTKGSFAFYFFKRLKNYETKQK